MKQCKKCGTIVEDYYYLLVENDTGGLTAIRDDAITTVACDDIINKDKCCKINGMHHTQGFMETIKIVSWKSLAGNH